MFMYVSKEKATSFPSTPTKVAAFFDDEVKGVELTYNPMYRRLHGLTNFYRKNNAQIGDLVEIEVAEHLRKYKFGLKKSLHLPC